VVPAALRDAAALAERISADERAADLERLRLVDGALPILNAESAGALPIDPGEEIHAVRPFAMLEDRASSMPTGGTLFLTSNRLAHIGEHSKDIQLNAIAESAVALERLLLLDLTDGSGLAIEVDQPRLLRVQLAAARANARKRGT
jgi:hypothetical protein